ncbi:MAG: SIS domain-containing protein [Pseudomonadota bacterium]
MTVPPSTHMAREIAEMPEAAARLAEGPARAISQGAADALRALDPPVLLTVARGSSDHAATYLSYAAQMLLRFPVASVGPSVSSIYDTALKARGLGVLAISQSGKSADILSLCAALRSEGGHVVALTNTAQSPMANLADEVIDIAAGPERAVAATKSYFNSIVAGLWLLADWAQDSQLVQALDRLPDAMRGVAADPALGALSDTVMSAGRAVVLGRGPGLGIAHEFALKLIETSSIHASSYSSAEVLHGPSAMLTGGYPVIALTTGAGSAMGETLERLGGQGARVLTLSPKEGTGHPLVDPLLDLQGIYAALEVMARAHGFDPDNPKHLQKETKTV